MFKKLKKRWEVESNLKLFLIMFSFSAAGSATLFVRRPIFEWLNIGDKTPFILKALLYIVTVSPSYFVMLLIIGSLLGQYAFFLKFEKKMISRFKRKR